MGLRMKNFNIMMVLILHRGEFPKRGAWTVSRFKGGLVDKRGWCF